MKFGTDIDEVWKTATNDLPLLEQEICMVHKKISNPLNT